MTKKINHKINKLPKSKIEIEGEIDSDIFEGFYKKALENIGKDFEVDGFRKGKVPENILISKIPEIKILEEMAELALKEHYPALIEEINLDVISQPQIAITKLARKNPLGFKIITSVMPEINLPDYKKIAKETLEKEKGEEITVSEKEIEDTILDIRKSRAKRKNIQEVAKDHVHDENCKHENENKEEELPEWNDEFVKSMGPFQNIEDFKEKLKENIKLEKINQAREKKRLKIIEKIIENTEIETPEILINTELEKILYRMESDITQMGLKFDDYLKHLQKTRDDLEKEFTPDAEKKAKLGLILNKISKMEKIIADEKEVEKEVNHILEHYKDADPEKARIYAENVLMNEKIFQLLEEQN